MIYIFLKDHSSGVSVHNECLGRLVTAKNTTGNVEGLTQRLLMLSLQDMVLWTMGGGGGGGAPVLRYTFKGPHDDADVEMKEKEEILIIHIFCI